MEKNLADLIREKKKFKSPAWHETVLKDREETYKAGKVTVLDWEQATKRIRKRSS
jgi:hypothetical protein